MDVIPVIDVRHGVAVKAVAGDRANYQPLVTPLGCGSEPLVVARGYMALHRFPVIYLADLDGIEGRGANLSLVRDLAGLAQVWVDNGAQTPADVASIVTIPGATAVIGSEMGTTPGELAVLMAAFSDRIVLSLDFRGPHFAGDPDLLETPAHWPDRVIAMTLTNVGGNAGPDLGQIAAIKTRGGRRRIFAAGGIGNTGDLAAARSAGASGALVATALHSGTITAADLAQVGGRDV